jgi:hypothetical protein
MVNHFIIFIKTLYMDDVSQGWVGSDVLRGRLQQFASSSSSSSSSPDGGAPVVLTRQPLFVDKAKQFPGAYFLIGADTVKVGRSTHQHMGWGGSQGSLP